MRGDEGILRQGINRVMEHIHVTGKQKGDRLGEGKEPVTGKEAGGGREGLTHVCDDPTGKFTALYENLKIQLKISLTLESLPAQSTNM